MEKMHTPALGTPAFDVCETLLVSMARTRLRSITLLLFAAPGAFALACGPDATLPPGDDFESGATGGSGVAAGTGGTAQAGTSSSATGGSGGTSSGGQGGVGTGGTGMVGAGGTAVGGGTSGGSSAVGGGAGQGATGNGGTSGGTSGSGGMPAKGGTFGGAGMPNGGSGALFGGGGRAGSTGLGGRSSGTGGAGGARGGAAGAAGTSVGGAGSVAFSQVAAIIQAQCGKSTCHGGRENPNLTSTNLTTLYNTLTSTTVRQCGSDHLVTKNDTANSALLELPQGKCSNFIMPQGCTTTPCLASADLTTITNWINAGAPGP